ncbi:hypothetical protein M514_01202 [Trichuris suis]|uniref:Uncharacterized protein n=1 Tax=Trichuris suis TaxID=68888 RepID=A0A085NN00_9BILA|nr:hypothetical protein M513_01202 [Trichuris suis]KFD70846.1 hypothetical protein M514_01202 [Trichuris suis]
MVRAKGRGIGWRAHFLGWTGDENPSQPHEIGESTLDDHKELCQGRLELELNCWSQVLRESRKP